MVFPLLTITWNDKNFNLKQSVRFMRLNKGIAIANGSIFALVMYIPFCGVTFAGFVAIISVVAATISTHQLSLKSQ